MSQTNRWPPLPQICSNLSLPKVNNSNCISFSQFVVVQLLSHVRLSATPWTAARQPSLSFTISRSLLKLLSFDGDAIRPSDPLLPPFSSCLLSFPASGSFLMSWLFTSGDQNIGVSASASVLPMTVQGIQPYTYIHPFSSNSHPIQPATQHWAEFHVLSSRSLLVHCFKYSSVYLLIPNSLTIPSPILPQATIRLFSKSVSLFLFCKKVDLYHLFLNST